MNFSAAKLVDILCRSKQTASNVVRHILSKIELYNG